MSNDDPFDNEFFAYTAEDFNYIDQICEIKVEAQPAATEDSQKGAPCVSIEIERSTDRKIKEDIPLDEVTQSPYSLFRKRGYLSVIDVVSPTWCELQFEYGLRQLRNKAVHLRPRSFVTEKGKEIQVNSVLATQNDAITAEGTKVHKVLEKQIHKEQVAIKVKSQEEFWALRLLDFLSRLKILKELGICREIPVWGIINGEAIMGSIDELKLAVNESKNRATKRHPTLSPKRRKSTGSSQTKLDSFITSSPNSDTLPASHEIPSPTYTVQILDNKTRKHRSVPDHADTLPSRLQLMLYWRLLNQVLSFDSGVFQDFCSRLGMNWKLPFSEIFQTDISTLIVNNQLNLHFLDITCLEDMLFPYTESIKEIDMNISTSLFLVYRLRSDKTERWTSPAKKEVPSAKSTSDTNNPPMSAIVPKVTETSDIDISKDDTKASSPIDATADVAEPMSIGGSTTPEPKKTSLKRKLSGRRRASDSSADCKSFYSSDDDTSPATNRKRLSSGLIGTKKFKYNEKLLNVHLANVLLWWHGKRRPKGVDVSNVSRCNSH
ncbi:hypothetical protein EW145_g2681 [Phellinidium pouzarii]|uniref:Uncharacterized protein n=1 Tax=Phellinidium pouzarii TaxID=167371 RepID=A0A4V3XD62_9AGAM|nr:hypothetical protein EW145_g2681 [Phellinidium pouzarii]